MVSDVLDPGTGGGRSMDVGNFIPDGILGRPPFRIRDMDGDSPHRTDNRGVPAQGGPPADR